MAGIPDANASEIYCQYIEGGIGGTLEDAAQSAHKRIRTIVLHRLQHHASCTTSRQRFHDGGRQGAYEIGIQAALFYRPRNALNHHIHRSRSTEHTDAHKDSYEIRDNLYRSSKTFLRSLDKCIIYIYFLPETRQDEAEDDAQENHVRSQGGNRVHRILVHLSESPNDDAYEGAHSQQSSEQYRLQDVDALPERSDDDSGKRSHERSHQDRDEDIRRLGCSIGGTEGKDGGRDDGES